MGFAGVFVTLLFRLKLTWMDRPQCKIKINKGILFQPISLNNHSNQDIDRVK